MGISETPKGTIARARDPGNQITAAKASMDGAFQYESASERDILVQILLEARKTNLYLANLTGIHVPNEEVV